MNIEKIIFREVQITDAAALTALMEQLGYPIEESIMRKNIQKYLLFNGQKAWVAEKSGEVIGSIAVAITNYFHRPGSFLRVIALIVDQNKRRLGIGKSLMELAEKYAKEQGCTHLELTCGAHRSELGSHDFYRNLGFSDLNDKKKYFGKLL